MHTRHLLAAGFLMASLGAAASAQGAPGRTSIIQDGRGNAAGISQSGSDNLAGIRQFGRGNTGAIIQDGTSNSACLVQTGRHLDGAIYQTGDNQSLGILQTRMGVREVSADTCNAITSRRDVMIQFAGRANSQPRSRR